MDFIPLEIWTEVLSDAAGSDGLPDGFQLLHNPPKVVRSHQELHKELLLAHKK